MYMLLKNMSSMNTTISPRNLDPYQGHLSFRWIPKIPPGFPDARACVPGRCDVPS